MQIETFRNLDNDLVSAMCRLNNMRVYCWQEKISAAERKVAEIKKSRLSAYRYLKKEITARVSEPARTILLKYYLYWKTTAEIAQDLGLSRRHVFRLKAKGIDEFNRAENDEE